MNTRSNDMYMIQGMIDSLQSELDRMKSNENSKIKWDSIMDITEDWVAYMSKDPNQYLDYNLKSESTPIKLIK
jgi:beta-mannanase